MCIYIVTSSHGELIVPENRPEAENDYSKQLIAKRISQEPEVVQKLREER